jgi:hypothetical protein
LFLFILNNSEKNVPSRLIYMTGKKIHALQPIGNGQSAIGNRQLAAGQLAGKAKTTPLPGKSNSAHR